MSATTVQDITNKFAVIDSSLSPRNTPGLSNGQKVLSPRTTLDNFVKQVVKKYVKVVATPYPINSHESAEELGRLDLFYHSCTAKLRIKIQKLERIDNRSEEEERQLNIYRNNIDLILLSIQEIEPLKQKRAMSRTHLIERTGEVRREHEERRLQHEITAFLAELNSTTAYRFAFLKERLIDLNLLIQGKPSRNARVRTSIVDGIKDLWRTAAATSIFDRGIQVMKVHEHAHNPDIASDPQDTNIRFKNIFERFLRHSGDAHQAPDTSRWNMQANETWANSTALKEGLEVDIERAHELAQRVSSLHKQATNQAPWKDIEKALTEKPDDQELLLRQIANLSRGCPGEYNVLMERYIRSCAQPMFTGTLVVSDLVERAKKFETVTLGFVPSGRDFDRSFLDDGSHRITMNLRCFMRHRNKEIHEFPQVTFTVTYTLTLDAEMNGIQLTSRAYDLVENSSIK